MLAVTTITILARGAMRRNFSLKFSKSGQNHNFLGSDKEIFEQNQNFSGSDKKHLGTIRNFRAAQ